jgi:hypothetical protein
LYHIPRLDASLSNSLIPWWRRQSDDDDSLLGKLLDEQVGSEGFDAIDVDPVGVLDPALALGGLAVRLTSGRDVPARRDELSDTRLQEGGGHDDGEVEVMISSSAVDLGSAPSRLAKSPTCRAITLVRSCLTR